MSPREIVGRGLRPGLLALLLLPVVYGCGYRRPALVQTEASVTLGGEPVHGASITLVSARPGRPVTGFSDEAGRLMFSTYGSKDGVPAGTYRAIVTKLVPTKKGARKLDGLRARQSGNAAEDVASEEMVEMAADDYENLLPPKYSSVDTTTIEVTIDRGTRQITLALEPETTPSKGGPVSRPATPAAVK